MVQLRKLFHKGNDQIGIYFGFDEGLKIKAKSIGAQWSHSHKCWYVLYNKENYNLIKRNFDDIEIVKDENNKRPSEPAVVQHENVHIAEVISEIQPTLRAVHKGLDPETVGRIVFTGSIGKYWILKVPYKEGLTPKLMDIKGVYWNKGQKAFFVLRHVNVKIKVEALLGIGEIFPRDYFNLERVVDVKKNRTRINTVLADLKTDFIPIPSSRENRFKHTLLFI
ncbi:MAG TPA: hypothetical protein DCL77_07230 [Prolixibacteraceae bacterium]|jgi:hypothetical protein|nr:hypothetical protein [Prolixibacteraceae bacterium]